MKRGRFIGKHKATLLALADDELLEAEREHARYVDALWSGGGKKNYATDFVGVYENRLKAIRVEVDERGLS